MIKQKEYFLETGLKSVWTFFLLPFLARFVF